MADQVKKRVVVWFAFLPLAFLLSTMCWEQSRGNTQPFVVDDTGVVELEIDTIPLGVSTTGAVELSELSKLARQLEGRRVRVHGRMHRSLDFKGITQFSFIPETRGETFSCTPGHFPLHGYVLAETVPGKSVDFTYRPITVEGVFRIEPDKFDGRLRTVYKIRDARITVTEERVGFRLLVSFFCC